MNANGTSPTNFSINDTNWNFMSHLIDGKTIPTFKDDLLCIGNVLFYLLNGNNLIFILRNTSMVEFRKNNK